MAVFRGPTNLHLGHPVWAASTYDPTTRDYVVTLEDEGDVERFRAVADLYRFREDTDAAPVDEPVDEPVDDEPEPPHDPPTGGDGGSDDVPDPKPGK